MFLVAHIKVEVTPRYLKDSPVMTGGKISLLMKSFG